MGSESWKNCKIGLFRPVDIRSLQNHMSAAANTTLVSDLIKRFNDDNAGHSVAD